MAVTSSATPLSSPTVGPGHSWDVTWTDGDYSGETFNEMEFVIVGGGATRATFDGAATLTFNYAGSPIWTGTLVNPVNGKSTDTYVSGTAVTLGSGLWDSITLSFTDPAPAISDVVVNVYLFYNGAAVTDLDWCWPGLPGGAGYTEYQNWDPIPDGGMTAVLLGMGMLGLACARRRMKK
jgi:hypothetical protein